MPKHTSLLVVLLLAAGIQAADATLYQSPTLSKTHIAFAYSGDLWTVPRDGGSARRKELYHDEFHLSDSTPGHA